MYRFEQARSPCGGVLQPLQVSSNPLRHQSCFFTIFVIFQTKNHAATEVACIESTILSKNTFLLPNRASAMCRIGHWRYACSWIARSTENFMMLYARILSICSIDFLRLPHSRPAIGSVIAPLCVTTDQKGSPNQPLRSCVWRRSPGCTTASRSITVRTIRQRRNGRGCMAAHRTTVPAARPSCLCCTSCAQHDGPHRPDRSGRDGVRTGIRWAGAMFSPPSSTPFCASEAICASWRR